MLARSQRCGLAQQVDQQRGERRHEQDRDAPQRPQPGRLQHRPAQQQQRGEGGRREAAPQVVEDLPARQRRQRVLHGHRMPTAWCGTGRQAQRGQEPRDDLPVAADPAVAAAHVGVVARRRILEQLHVADQSRACVAALQQVVAEDAVFRQAPAQHPLEGVDVVDALADERTLVEQVLIDVGDCARVGVDARVAAEQPRVACACGAGQADADTGLQNAVAPDHARCRGFAAEAWPVQRMGHRADELPRRVARQLRVGVERDDVAHAPQQRRVADDQREAIGWPRLLVAAQQRVQVRELAALALVAHPHPVARVPAARAVEQEESIGIRRARRLGPVFVVQRLDLLPRMAQQCVVAGQRLLRRIVEVGEQAEVQLCVAVGHEAHFQCVDQIVDALLAAQHRRHHHQRARRRRNAEREVHARQRARACSTTPTVQFTSAIASWLVARNSTSAGANSHSSAGNVHTRLFPPCDARQMTLPPSTSVRPITAML